MNITEFAKIIKSGPVQDITEEQIDKLYRHMNMVLEKNRVMNLTSIEDPYEFVVKHILDSLTAAEYVKDCRTIIDVGTGAGFPGMPLKLLYPDKEVTFLDSTAKKVEFIRECGSALSVEPARYVLVFRFEIVLPVLRATNSAFRSFVRFVQFVFFLRLGNDSCQAYHLVILRRLH
jgi:16S rRNA (guanine(527)-N(7))-methyltransferase RsmG